MNAALQNWLAQIAARHPTEIELGLQRIRTVAEKMALAKPAKHVISVAGTNGKGSTVAFIEAIAGAAGLRVGCYTSPHLLRYNERIRINGKDVDDAQLLAAFEAIEAARAQTPLTYFETGTLAALWLFAQTDLDIAVLEVGLGGRLDAVNLIDADCAIITTVDIDHQQWLGDTIEAIGAEKAGIARPWKPLILGDDDPPASVLRHAYAIGASSWRIGSDFFVDVMDDGRHWQWREVGLTLSLPLPQLRAPVQLRNAACAIAALRSLDVDITEAAYAHGVAHANLPARLQKVLREGVQWYVDVGHNRQAAAALAQALSAQDAQSSAPRPFTHALYAGLADKDSAAVFAALAGQVDCWHVAGSVEAGARGQTAAQCLARLPAQIAENARSYASVAAALPQLAPTQGQRVLVFGSFYAAAEALQWLDASSHCVA